jgi:predicted glycoside hydrolase/deacetylase ChbG (UPF0249 family)
MQPTQPNPFLRRLGLADDARVVVLHADDIGMCQSALTAWRDLLDFGVLTSAAAMPPCPWFLATAAACRELRDHPRLDMGAHLTLTSEWAGYRWGPLSTADRASGLLDGQGCLHRMAKDVAENADLGAVEVELRAQIERALAEGIDVTHIDSHMFTLFHPRFLPIYFRLGFEYGVPAFMLRDVEAVIEAAGLDEADGEQVRAAIAAAEAAGMPLFDRVHVLSLDTHEGRLEEAMEALAALPPGLSNVLLHPSRETAELKAIAPDWRCRVADRALFLDPAWRDALADAHVVPVGFRALREAMRAARGEASAAP